MTNSLAKDKQGADKKEILGFTLIEMAIVIIVIGLIVGGVLVGRDLVAASERRAVITKIEKYNTAVNAFKNKYNCLPGDCADATKFWPQMTGCPFGPYTSGGYTAATAATTCNGDGNGNIGGQDALNESLTERQEIATAWNQLGLAGLIPGNYQMVGLACNTCYDANAGWNAPDIGLRGGTVLLVYGGTTGLSGWGFYPGGSVGKHVFLVGSNGIGYLSGGVSFFLFTPNDARQIDAKIDDGLPQTGTVVSTNDQGTMSCTATTGASYLQSDIVNTNISIWSGGNGCALMFLAKF